VVGIVYDWFTRRAVHRVYWIGLVTLFVVQVPLLPQINGRTVTWLNEGLAAIGERLSTFYQPDPTIEF